MSDEINKLIADYEEASEDVGRYGRDAADLERRAAARFALSDAIAALRAERDELAARLEAAEKAAGHSEFYSWPLTTTISRALTERVIEKCWHDRPTGCLFDFAQRVRSATIAECAAVIDKRADILEKISDPTNPSVTNCRLAAAAIRALDKGETA